MDTDRHMKYNKPMSKCDNYIDLGLDLHTLDIFCKMIVSSNRHIRRGNLQNMSTLISIIDPNRYNNDSQKAQRVSFIKKGIEARLMFNLEDPYMIMQHINGGIIDDTIINIEAYQDISDSDIQWINNSISETLQYSHIYTSVDDIMDVCTRFKTADYGTKGDIVKEFKQVVNDVQNDFRRSQNEDHTEMMFSLREDILRNTVTETYNKLVSPAHKLVCGMQGMNELLGGGFESTRVYIYFGLPGEGKSGTILNLIYQIKKYNKDYRTKDPTKRPCIVLLTMENSVEESIERLFGMATDREKMTEYDLESVISMLKNEGELTLTDDNPIDIIIKYKATNSVDTGYLYTLTDDLEDQGLEVIAMFQDYIGRIKSTQRFQDTRLEYGAVVDDFKTYAQLKDVPVISVAQLNRDASKHIDEGRKSSKSDLVRSLGRSNVSESMLILNNVDGGFMIAPELTSDGKKYLGVQRIKIRYKAGAKDCIYLPFSANNSIKLMEDYGSKPTYMDSLMPNGPITMQTIPRANANINSIEEIGAGFNTVDKSIGLFSTNVVSSQMDTLDFKNREKKKEVINPMEFDEGTEFYSKASSY